MKTIYTIGVCFLMFGCASELTYRSFPYNKEWEYPDDKFIVKFDRDTSGIYIIKGKKQKPIFQNFGYKRFDDYIVITSTSIVKEKISLRQGDTLIVDKSRLHYVHKAEWGKVHLFFKRIL